MHFKNENDNKTHQTHHAATTSTSSSTSSTDSGVIIIDNHTTIDNKKSNKNNNNNNDSNIQNQRQNNNQNNNNSKNKIIYHKNATNANVYEATIINIPEDKIDSNTTINTDKIQNNEKFNNNQNSDSNRINQNIIGNNNDEDDECNIIKPKSINIENIIKITKANVEGKQNHLYNNNNTCSHNNTYDNDQENIRVCIDDANISINNITTNTSNASKHCSPTVSIRSTSISIVSIDENAFDSSIVDSDSDREADAEGVHTNYVVKKLGQQTTYPPGSKELPNINKGLTVISQKINPNSLTMPENVLNGDPMNLPSKLSNGDGPMTPTSPQIGSIALNNSTDVTFGDKHFYEGPVTIQQILIDRRDKWKAEGENGGHDNPVFTKESDYDATGTKAKHSAPTQPETPYSFICKRKAVIITASIVVLTALIGVILLTTSLPKSKKVNDDDEDSRKNIPINSTIAFNKHPNDEEPLNELLVMSRRDWSAREPKGELDKLKLPVHRVIISHTASETCMERETCIDRVRVIQNFHMDSMGWDDIGYNYLIGGDGYVYSARGWNNEGAHTKGYNSDSIGISFIGTFTTIEPTKRQVQAAKLLIEEGVRLMKLAPDFCVYGARQLGATESPGKALFEIIKTWPHWSQSIECHGGS